MVMVAGATKLIRRSDIRLPPLIPVQYASTKKTPPRSPVLLPRLGMDSSEDVSSGGESEVNVVESISNHRNLFVCGFVSKRWHNGALQALMFDLMPKFYVSCNDESENDLTSTKEQLSLADAMIFFVNEFTLGDVNCLLTLQYAWQIMVPVIMIRPPRTKLVLCKRSNRTRDDMRIVGSGSIIRSPTARWALVNDDNNSSLDYELLQDILYEGYKLSVVYDRLDHTKSVERIKERINSVFRPENYIENGEKLGFYLSPSNDSSNSVTITSQSSVKNKIRAKRGKEQKKEIRLSQSLNNLESKPKEPKKKIRCTPRNPRKNRILDLGNSSDEEESPDSNETLSNSENFEDVNGNGEPEEVSTPKFEETTVVKKISIGSNQASLDRRMSLSSLEDRRSYTTTQYLLFPLRDPTKKPQLIRFPEDLNEEKWKDDSVWGSDTSLEEEIDLAPRINAGISIDEEDNLSYTFSPSPAPAPYIDPI